MAEPKVKDFLYFLPTFSILVKFLQILETTTFQDNLSYDSIVRRKILNSFSKGVSIINETCVLHVRLFQERMR